VDEHTLVGLASVIVLGIVSQWIAWRLHLPAILLLLICGIIAGPVTGVLDPVAVFGDLLYPLVSVSVAIILFEGGLSLRFSELRQGGRVFRNLVTTGILVTWVLVTLAAYFIVGLDFQLALLLGAVLVVSGPTVIIPLLRQVRPKGSLGSIIKWEGIVNDPIGALLAVLVFEVILSGWTHGGTTHILIGVVKAFLFGGLIGIAGAAVVVVTLQRYLVPDFLQNPFSLMLVVMAYVASNALQPESGLLAVTVMGMALANQKYVSIRHILEFKENLRVLLIASLFIILSAKLSFDQLALSSWANWLFVAILILLVRPLAVWVSTLGTSLTWREKAFLAWMAPRGIVAAAVVSVFAIRLAQSGVVGSDILVPLTFEVIIGTVAVYGLTAPFVARRLKVAQPNPQGILFAGAAPWIQEIADVVKAEGFEVVLVDTNWHNISIARKRGLRAHYANILSENLITDVNLDGIGKLAACTPNDEVNSLAALHFVDMFSRTDVYQVPPAETGHVSTELEMPQHLRGRYLYRNDATAMYLRGRFLAGAVVKRHSMTDEFDIEAFHARYGTDALPLFVVTESGTLQVATTDHTLSPKTGQTLISLVDPVDNGAVGKEA